MTVVFVHGPRKPGDVWLGSGPKPGFPVDEQGRTVIVHRYGPAPKEWETLK